MCRNRHLPSTCYLLDIDTTLTTADPPSVTHISQPVIKTRTSDLANPQERYALNHPICRCWQDAELEPDVVTYNTLVSLAGQAGQLQRAMDTVTEMEVLHLSFAES